MAKKQATKRGAEQVKDKHQKTLQRPNPTVQKKKQSI